MTWLSLLNHLRSNFFFSFLRNGSITDNFVHSGSWQPLGVLCLGYWSVTYNPNQQDCWPCFWKYLGRMMRNLSELSRIHPLWYIDGNDSQEPIYQLIWSTRSASRPRSICPWFNGQSKNLACNDFVTCIILVSQWPPSRSRKDMGWQHRGSRFLDPVHRKTQYRVARVHPLRTFASFYMPM